MEVKGLLRVVSHSPSSLVSAAAAAAGGVFGGGGLGGGTVFLFSGPSFTPVKLFSNSVILCRNPGSRGSSLTSRFPFSSVVMEILPVYPVRTVQPFAIANVPSLTGIQTCRWAGRGGCGCGWGGGGGRCGEGGAGAGTQRLRRPRVAAVGEISGDKPSQALSLKNKIISDFFTEKKIHSIHKPYQNFIKN